MCEKFHVFGEEFECVFVGVKEQSTFIFVAFHEQEEMRCDVQGTSSDSFFFSPEINVKLYIAKS